MEIVYRCDMFSKYFLLVIGKDWFSSISGIKSRHFHEKITNNSVVCISTNLQPKLRMKQHLSIFVVRVETFVTTYVNALC